MIFEVIIECYNIASVLCFGFLAIGPVGYPALEGEILTTGPQGSPTGLPLQGICT